MSDNIMNINKFGDLLKNARRVQEQMEKTQKELGTVEIIGESGGGLVSILLIGGRRAKSVHIDPSLLEDRDMLQDLIVAAVTDALQKSENIIGEKMHSSLSGAIRAAEQSAKEDDK